MFEIDENQSWEMPIEVPEGAEAPRVFFRVPSATDLRRFEAERRSLYIELGIELDDAMAFLSNERALEFILDWMARYVVRLEGIGYRGEAVEWNEQWLADRGTTKADILSRLGASGTDRLMNFNRLSSAIMYGMDFGTKKKPSTTSGSKSAPIPADASSARASTTETSSSTTEQPKRTDTTSDADAETAQDSAQISSLENSGGDVFGD